VSGDEQVSFERRNTQGSIEHTVPVRDSCFGPDEYNVRTGIDVKAKGPEAAMVAAVKKMGLKHAEGFCFHVEHLRTGRKWYVDPSPSGDIDVQDWNK